MTNEVVERRKLWLSWLELPWDTVREDLIAEMRRVGMSQEDLAYELRKNGYPVTHATVSNWIRQNTARAPSLDALQILVSVFAEVSLGSWTKGAYLMEAELAYDL